MQDLPMLKAKVWSDALRCADSLPACSPGMSEGTQHTVNQRHSAASVAAILSVLLCLCSSVDDFEYFTGSSE